MTQSIQELIAEVGELTVKMTETRAEIVKLETLSSIVRTIVELRKALNLFPGSSASVSKLNDLSVEVTLLIEETI